jgi:hypothetical protein
MRIGAVVRALEINGEWITLRRLSGTSPRLATDVLCRAKVSIGGASFLIGSTQQNADRVLMTSREIEAASWPAPPRHGDQVVYADGTTAVVQGRADLTDLEDGSVYTLAVMG